MPVLIGAFVPFSDCPSYIPLERHIRALHWGIGPRLSDRRNRVEGGKGGNHPFMILAD